MPCCLGQDIDFECFKTVYNAVKKNARGTAEPSSRWAASINQAATPGAAARVAAEVLVSGGTEADAEEAQRARVERAKTTAMAMEEVRERNEKLRGLIERRFMTRHVERKMVEDEYTKARRLSVLKRRERMGRRATYKEAEEEVSRFFG